MSLTEPQTAKAVFAGAAVSPGLHPKKIKIHYVLKQNIGSFTISSSESTLMNRYPSQFTYAIVEAMILPEPGGLRVLQGARNLMLLTQFQNSNASVQTRVTYLDLKTVNCRQVWEAPDVPGVSHRVPIPCNRKRRTGRSHHHSDHPASGQVLCDQPKVCLRSQVLIRGVPQIQAHCWQPHTGD